ncbi:MAG: WbqC-like protein family protein [Methanomethylovorans sp. PtaU1.Bin093]|uniref:WbqC family protein n=1 Tax=Methanomethylovorans sp. PtaU1.Bin093 TaxID=1811679 RepID=UPI0009D08009|nr:WbqC family protein [Methanomethylovorans sp. PtaU1.Bin093]OPY18525.1 MAG: WbqC-like protein family protein [Methanomethylovorans sp. PtaU1.Bin093]
MIVAGHQPTYLPYLGFFDKMSKSDIFMILDDVQFNKKDFQHRNRIRIPEGWKWLTVPIVKEGKIPINEILINNQKINGKPVWSDTHLRIIDINYNKTPYYESYIEDLSKIYNRKHTHLADLNLSIIQYLIKAFEIDIELVYSSKLGFTTTSSQRIADIVNSLGGDTYLSGIGGLDYLDQSVFKEIKVEYQQFEHPMYTQRYTGFEKNMAAIDALFNVGSIPK